MKQLPLIAAICCLFTTAGAQQKEIPPRADTLFTHIMAKARPAVTNWVKATALKYRGSELTEEKAKAEATTAKAGIAGLGNSDIEAMAFLVLMQAAKSAQDDLKGIMAEVKATNDAKAKQREAINRQNAQKAAATAALKDSGKRIQANPALLQKAGNTKTDNINDMDQPQQLKLQQAMDRSSKMTEALSNLLKKIADTEQSIIDNLK